jgi:hypothetical protein
VTRAIFVSSLTKFFAASVSATTAQDKLAATDFLPVRALSHCNAATSTVGLGFLAQIRAAGLGDTVGDIGFHQVCDAVDNMTPPDIQLLGRPDHVPPSVAVNTR